MRTSYLTAIALGVFPAGVSAQGSDATSVHLSLQKTAEAAQYDSAAVPEAPFAVRALGENQLRAIAGREDTTQIAQNEQFAGVANNSVGDNAKTGEARISDNAFQNMSGLSILNVNTGNNVAINASMSVNVSITPAP